MPIDVYQLAGQVVFGTPESYRMAQHVGTDGWAVLRGELAHIVLARVPEWEHRPGIEPVEAAVQYLADGIAIHAATEPQNQ